MLTLYRRQIYHDRRRIALAAVLTLAAGHLFSDLLPDPLSIATETLLALAFLALIPVFTAHFRAKRHWVEITAIGTLVVTLTGSLFPSGVFGWHGPAVMLLLQIPAFCALLLGLKQLIYGPWSDSFAPRRRYLVKTTLCSRLPVDELWYGMVPTPGFADRNPDRDVVSIEFADACKSVVRLTTWVPPHAGTGEVLLEFHEITALKHARFHLKVMRGHTAPCAQGETEMVFEDRGRHRVVHLRHKVTGLSPRRAILGYFDDTFGRLMTARLNAIETRVATGRPAKAVSGITCWLRPGAEVDLARDPDTTGYRTAYGRQRSADETKALQALGRI